MSVLLFLLVPLLFGFACGYGVRAWISRRRRRRYRRRRGDGTRMVCEQTAGLFAGLKRAQDVVHIHAIAGASVSASWNPTMKKMRTNYACRPPSARHPPRCRPLTTLEIAQIVYRTTQSWAWPLPSSGWAVVVLTSRIERQRQERHAERFIEQR